MDTEYSGERFLPEKCEGEIAIEHYQRYQLAKQLVKNKIVLDAACGEGYGSRLLAETAEQVIGLDIDEKVIAKANQKYGSSKLSYISGSIEKLPFKDKVFDVIVSYETIEHVNVMLQESFLNEINRVLKTDGKLIISTPNKAVYTDLVKGENKFHIKEFYIEEFITFLKKFFYNIELFFQYPSTGYFITKEEKIAVKSNAIKREESRYIIAICSNIELNNKINREVLTYFDDSMYYFLNTQVHELEKKIAEIKKEADVFEEKQRKAIEEQKEYILHLEADLKEQKKYIIYHEENSKERNEYIIKMEKNVESQKEYILHLENDLKKQKECIIQDQKVSEEQKEYIEHIENDLNKQKEYIMHLEKDIKEQKKYMEQVEDNLEKQKNYTIHLEKDMKEQKEYIIQLEERLKEQKDYIIHLEKDIEEQKGYILHLEKDIEILKKQN